MPGPWDNIGAETLVHAPPWNSGDIFDSRGQFLQQLKRDVGVDNRADGMPLITKGKTFVFGQVQTPGIADGAILDTKLHDGAVTTNKIAADAVDSSKILNGSIVNADINNAAAIAPSKFAAGAAAQILETIGGVPQWANISTVVTDPGLQMSGGFANASASVALTTAFQTIPGCGNTFAGGTRGGTAIVFGNFTFTVATTGFGVFQGCFNVSGADNGLVCQFADVATLSTFSCMLIHAFPIAMAGSVPITLRAKKTINAGSITVAATQTIMTWVYVN